MVKQKLEGNLINVYFLWYEESSIVSLEYIKNPFFSGEEIHVHSSKDLHCYTLSTECMIEERRNGGGSCYVFES
jgi:hypothetical protein